MAFVSKPIFKSKFLFFAIRTKQTVSIFLILKYHHFLCSYFRTATNTHMCLLKFNSQLCKMKSWFVSWLFSLLAFAVTKLHCKVTQRLTYILFYEAQINFRDWKISLFNQTNWGDADSRIMISHKMKLDVLGPKC